MPINDLISRKAAIRAVHEEFDECLVWDESGKTTANAVESVLDLVQSVDIVPVRYGRWVKMTGMIPPEFHGHYECSECGWHLSGVRQMKNREEEFAYCPSCGAKMNGGNDDA